MRRPSGDHANSPTVRSSLPARRAPRPGEPSSAGASTSQRCVIRGVESPLSLAPSRLGRPRCSGSPTSTAVKAIF
jgi:hypothetical protein